MQPCCVYRRLVDATPSRPACITCIHATCNTHNTRAISSYTHHRLLPVSIPHKTHTISTHTHRLFVHTTASSPSHTQAQHTQPALHTTPSLHTTPFLHTTPAFSSRTNAQNTQPSLLFAQIIVLIAQPNPRAARPSTAQHPNLPLAHVAARTLPTFPAHPSPPCTARPSGETMFSP